MKFLVVIASLLAVSSASVQGEESQSYKCIDGADGSFDCQLTTLSSKTCYEKVSTLPLCTGVKKSWSRFPCLPDAKSCLSCNCNSIKGLGNL